MIIAAVFASLICAATFVIKIPSPLNGYINLGDCFVLLAGWMLSKKRGAAASAIGSALADVIAGYALFAPATFVIKGLVAFLAHVLFGVLKEKTKAGIAALLAGLAAECAMILGYFVYESFLYGVGAAASGIPFNAIQGAAGVAAALALYDMLGARLVKGR